MENLNVKPLNPEVPLEPARTRWRWASCERAFFAVPLNPPVQPDRPPDEWVEGSNGDGI